MVLLFLINLNYFYFLLFSNKILYNNNKQTINLSNTLILIY